MQTVLTPLRQLEDKGFQWLLRSDEKRGYFLHVTTEDPFCPGHRVTPTSRSVYQEWSGDLAGLVMRAENACKEYLRGRGVETLKRKIHVGIDPAKPGSEDESMACVMEQIDGVLKVLGFERLGPFTPAGPDGFMGSVRRMEEKEKTEAGLAAMAGEQADTHAPAGPWAGGHTLTPNARLQNKIDGILKRATGDLGLMHVDVLRKASRDIQRAVLDHVTAEAKPMA